LKGLVDETSACDALIDKRLKS